MYLTQILPNVRVSRACTYALLGLLLLGGCKPKKCANGTTTEILTGCDSQRWTLYSEQKIVTVSGNTIDSLSIFRRGEYQTTFSGSLFEVYYKTPNISYTGYYQIAIPDSLTLITTKSTDPDSAAGATPYLGVGKLKPTWRYAIVVAKADTLILRDLDPAKAYINRRLTYVPY